MVSTKPLCHNGVERIHTCPCLVLTVRRSGCPRPPRCMCLTLDLSQLSGLVIRSEIFRQAVMVWHPVRYDASLVITSRRGLVTSFGASATCPRVLFINGQYMGNYLPGGSIPAIVDTGRPPVGFGRMMTRRSIEGIESILYSGSHWYRLQRNHRGTNQGS
jgi:hypothetical protein